MKNESARRLDRRRTPAFLTDAHRGMERPALQRESRPGWSPDRSAGKALGLLPKLTAEIGFALAGRDDVSIEILPGTPTTVAFTVGGKLLSLMVLPVEPDQACMLLGVAPLSTSDLVADQLWEEQREVSSPETLLSELSVWP